MPSKKKPMRTLPTLLLVLCLCTPVGAAWAEDAQIDYDPDGGMLAVEADRVPLERLLGEIALHTGVEFRLLGGADMPVSLSLPQKPIAESLRRFARRIGFDHILYFDEKEPNRVLSMRLLERGGGDSERTETVVGGDSSAHPGEAASRQEKVDRREERLERRAEKEARPSRRRMPGKQRPEPRGRSRVLY